MKVWIKMLSFTIATPACASTQIAQSVVDTCLLTSNFVAGVEYESLDAPAVISDDDFPGYTTFTYPHDGYRLGYATRLRGSGDRIVIGRKTLPISKATRLGPDAPTGIQATLAIYGIVMTNSDQYFCITSNFDGIGRSGSFQNIRAVFIAPLPRRGRQAETPRLYYGVGDIRKLNAPTEPTEPTD